MAGRSDRGAPHGTAGAEEGDRLHAAHATQPKARPPARLRSLLYTPADRPERYGKAWREGAADIVCADLEDAVAPGAKAEARKALAKELRATPAAKAGTQRAVRINAWGTEACAADLAAVLPAQPDLLVLPKAESPEQVVALARHIERAAPGLHPRIVPILETPRGVLEARAIAGANSLVAAVCFGAEDLAAAAGMRRTRDSLEVLTARQLVVLGASAAGVPAIDMITPDFRDLARTRADAQQARDFGFRGKMCIHPAQVAEVHAAFAPSEAEAAFARKVMAAVREAGVGSGGVIVVDGQMVDVPVIRQAETVLALLD